MTDRHDEDLRRAFDGQARAFEASPVQADAAALARLVAFADLAPGSRVLDAGCGPGLVSEALLAAGHDVVGVDLSGQMVSRAQARCARFGARARFEQGSVLALAADAPFDAAMTRYVVHHVEDPGALVRAQAARLRPGGAVIVCDQTCDADPERARWHRELERARDRTHVRHLTPAGLVDLAVSAGLVDVRFREEPFELDLDEWFDRGTPAAPKAEVRSRLLAGTARGFAPEPLPDGRVRIRAWRAYVRGVRPA